MEMTQSPVDTGERRRRREGGGQDSQKSGKRRMEKKVEKLKTERKERV